MTKKIRLEKPTLQQIKNNYLYIPCFDEIMEIVEYEMSNGNVLLNIGDAGAMPDETCIIFRFKFDAVGNYEKTYFIDNSGCSEVWFGCSENV